MNFKQFQDNVNEMANELSGINLEDVKIEHTKFDGNDCLWAMHGDKIVTYFKW